MLTNWRIQQWGLKHMMYQADRARFFLSEEESIFQCNFQQSKQGIKKKSSQRQTLLRAAEKKENGQQSQVVTKEVQSDTRKKFTGLQRETVESHSFQAFQNSAEQGPDKPNRTSKFTFLGTGDSTRWILPWIKIITYFKSVAHCSSPSSPPLKIPISTE